MFSWIASSASRVREVLRHPPSLSSVKVEYYESIIKRVPHYIGLPEQHDAQLMKFDARSSGRSSEAHSQLRLSPSIRLRMSFYVRKLGTRLSTELVRCFLPSLIDCDPYRWNYRVWWNCSAHDWSLAVSREAMRYDIAHQEQPQGDVVRHVKCVV